MQLLRSINSAVVDLYHILFDPVGSEEDRDAISDLPVWFRSLVGWVVIALFFATLLYWA